MVVFKVYQYWDLLKPAKYATKYELVIEKKKTEIISLSYKKIHNDYAHLTQVIYPNMILFNQKSTIKKFLHMTFEQINISFSMLMKVTG